MAVNVMSRTVKYSPSQQIAYGDTAAKSEASYDSWFDDPGLLSNAAYNLAVDNGLAFFYAESFSLMLSVLLLPPPPLEMPGPWFQALCGWFSFFLLCSLPFAHLAFPYPPGCFYAHLAFSYAKLAFPYAAASPPPFSSPPPHTCIGPEFVYKARKHV